MSDSAQASSPRGTASGSTLPDEPPAISTTRTSGPAVTRFPLAALVVMACTTFIGIVTETMPAGLLPQIARGLRVSDGAAGGLVSAYAVGAVLGAIPAVMLSRGARRKPLLCAGLLGFLLANTATALAPALLAALLILCRSEMRCCRS
ncbi:hypothetical protein ACFTZF_48885 [Streptomyces mirabilis]|uniref:hypothetical protein n=1 Tax=Streptomyces mirabilis TaxID=68239 RepID=UPI00363BA7FC